jgi:hypothetical protein
MNSLDQRIKNVEGKVDKLCKINNIPLSTDGSRIKKEEYEVNYGWAFLAAFIFIFIFELYKKIFS